jgi:hypothetical protein
MVIDANWGTVGIGRLYPYQVGVFCLSGADTDGVIAGARRVQGVQQGLLIRLTHARALVDDRRDRGALRHGITNGLTHAHRLNIGR